MIFASSIGDQRGKTSNAWHGIIFEGDEGKVYGNPTLTDDLTIPEKKALDMPVLQPLIGMDKRDIVKIAREIGTFDTSILPYEDCCTVFTPRHPKTRPTVAEVAEAESALDIDALVREAVDGIERIRIDL